MDFNKLYTMTVGKEQKSYELADDDQTARKLANYVNNPNAIYQVVKIENPSGNPMYTLGNMSNKNDIIDMNFKTIQDAEIYAIANKMKMKGK